MNRSSRLSCVTFCLLAALLAWDASGLDLPMARWFGGAQGFPLNDHWLLTKVLHSGARSASWLLAVGLILCIWWPVGVMQQIGIERRVQLAVTSLAAVLAISSLKGFSHTSCPWDLHEFGGLARYVSHWSWAIGSDGGSGHCFPAGHASSGFAFLSGYFAFRGRAPRLARRWLAIALTVGFVLGMAQQIRGAHFMSHTLWTGWICWATAWAIDSAWRLHTLRRSAADATARALAALAPSSAAVPLPRGEPESALQAALVQDWNESRDGPPLGA